MAFRGGASASLASPPSGRHCESVMAYAHSTSSSMGGLATELVGDAVSDQQKELNQSNNERQNSILLQLLNEVTEFIARKELSARLAASTEWRNLHQQVDNNVFEAVIQVCEDRMRRLQQHVSPFLPPSGSSQGKQ